MIIERWTFYSLETGRWLGAFIEGDATIVEQNTPSGARAFPLREEPDAWRMEGEELVERDAAEMAAEKEEKDRKQNRNRIIALIGVREAKQARAIREAMLGKSGAEQRLKDLEDEIEALRAQLT